MWNNHRLKYRILFVFRKQIKNMGQRHCLKQFLTTINSISFLNLINYQLFRNNQLYMYIVFFEKCWRILHIIKLIGYFEM